MLRRRLWPSHRDGADVRPCRNWTGRLGGEVVHALGHGHVALLGLHESGLLLLHLLRRRRVLLARLLLLLLLRHLLLLLLELLLLVLLLRRRRQLRELLLRVLLLLLLLLRLLSVGRRLHGRGSRAACRLALLASLLELLLRRRVGAVVVRLGALVAVGALGGRPWKLASFPIRARSLRDRVVATVALVLERAGARAVACQRHARLLLARKCSWGRLRWKHAGCECHGLALDARVGVLHVAAMPLVVALVELVGGVVAPLDLQLLEGLLERHVLGDELLAHHQLSHDLVGVGVEAVRRGRRRIGQAGDVDALVGHLGGPCDSAELWPGVRGLVGLMGGVESKPCSLGLLGSLLDALAEVVGRLARPPVVHQLQ